jgi:hypothetical protein
MIFNKLGVVYCLSTNEENDIFVNQNLLTRQFYFHISHLMVREIKAE